MILRRFVILMHNHPFLHWDFLVEGAESASTWRLMREPCLNEPILAEPIADHRLMYLEYEGPVSGNRGQVVRTLSGVVTSDTFGSDDAPSRVFELAQQSFATRAEFFQSSDGRWFVRFATSIA